MIFDLLNDLAGTTGKTIGTVVGAIAGVSHDVISKTLKCSEELVAEAIKAGAKTMDEVKDFIDSKK